MLAAFRGANQSALAGGIGGVFQNGGELFVFDAGFVPLVGVEKNLRALILHFGGGVGKFAAQLLGEARQCDGGIFRFIGQRVFIEKSLIVLRSGDKFARGFFGAGAGEQ